MFILHDLEGLTPTEIAAVVDAPVLTVRTRLFYARRELEEKMRDHPALATLVREQGGFAGLVRDGDGLAVNGRVDDETALGKLSKRGDSQ
ncbi:MAG: hypothetical protein NVSMB1_03750 [Polyangiales bacterium]